MFADGGIVADTLGRMLLDDGRTLLVRSGKGDRLVARQKGKGPPILVGDTVESKPGEDKKTIVLEAISRTKKDIRFKILGIRTPVEEET